MRELIKTEGIGNNVYRSIWRNQYGVYHVEDVREPNSVRLWTYCCPTIEKAEIAFKHWYR